MLTHICQFLDPHLAITLIEMCQKSKCFNFINIEDLKLQALLKTKSYESLKKQLIAIKNSSNQAHIQKLIEEAEGKQSLTIEKIKDLQSKLSKLNDWIDTNYESLQAEKFPPAKMKELDPILNNGALYKDAVECVRICYDIGQFELKKKHIDVLFQLVDDDDLVIQLLWGKLLTNLILKLEGTDDKPISEVQDDVKILRGKLDSKDSTDLVGVVANRAHILHIALIMCLHSKASDSELEYFIKLCLTENYMGTIQICTPHLMRYLIASVFITKGIIKDWQKDFNDISFQITKDTFDYHDEITEFIRTLHIEFNFKKANAQIDKIMEVVEDDYFLKPFKTRLWNNLQSIFFETYFKIYHSLTFSTAAQYLKKSEEDAEFWIVNLIREAHIEAHIDTHNKVIKIVNQLGNPQTQVLFFLPYVTAKNSQFVNKSRELFSKMNFTLNKLKKLSK